MFALRPLPAITRACSRMFALRPLPTHVRPWEGVDDVVLEALVALGDAARF